MGAAPPAGAIACGPDRSGDGTVNILDVSIVGSCVGQNPATVPTCSDADPDHDGEVDSADLAFVQASFGQTRDFSTPEVCDGVDNDCDGVPDDGGVCNRIACGPDRNGDGTVNILDVSIVGSCIGSDPQTVPQCSDADSDGDRDVDSADLAFVQASFGETRNFSTPEICDGIDNNCDGAADEGDVCGPKLGFLRGEAFDDSLGLPLAGATARILLTGSAEEPSPIEVDANGRFVALAFEGETRVRIEKAGFTSVDRVATVPPDGAVTVLDARLTPIDGQSTAIPAAGGEAQNTAATVTLAVPPGAGSAPVEVRLTELSNQGLAGPLPLGWSPLAAVEITPPSLTFAQSASLRLPNPTGGAPGAQVAAAVYDRVQSKWIARAPGAVDPTGNSVVLALQSAGQFALIAPDGPPFVPPSAAVGAALRGVAAVRLPAGLVTQGEVSPPAAPPGPEARAIGTIRIQSTQGFPSGTRVAAHVSERFDLVDGTLIVPQPFVQDLLVFGKPGFDAAGQRGTPFPITPSQEFTLQDLTLGRITIEVRVPESDAPVAIVGSAGGQVAGAGGALLQLPGGALTFSTAIAVKAADPARLVPPIPSGLVPVQALDIDLSGAKLGASALLSVPAAGVAAGTQVVFAASFRDRDGVPHLRIVALGEVVGSRIESRTAIGGVALPGIAVGGQYVVLRPASPLSFAAGTVREPGGASIRAGALVTSDTAAFADESAEDGRYLVANLSGSASRVQAIDLRTGDAGSEPLTPGGSGQVANVNVTLAQTPLGIVGSTPEPGAVDVALDVPIRVEFSRPLNPASLSSSTVALEVAGVLVPGSASLSVNGRTLSFVPTGALSSATAYQLALGALQDLLGNTLPQTEVPFTTRDTSRGEPPPAGEIDALLPDEDGFVNITGTQGSAEGNSAVTVTNLRTAETFTSLAASDGSFRLRIPAALGDDLGLTFRNAGRQEVSFVVSQLEDPDGTTAIGPSGGTVTGPGDRRARILPRALTAAGTFRLAAASEGAGAPSLPAGFSQIDAFHFEANGSAFNSLRSLRLSEGQDRFDERLITSVPLAGSASFAVPTNFLINGTLKFFATAEDQSGFRASVNETTLVVGGTPPASRLSKESSGQFPTVLLDVPEEASLGQLIEVKAFARTARFEFDVPLPSGISAGTPLLLAKLVEVAGTPWLALVDELEAVQEQGNWRASAKGALRPGASSGGDYLVISANGPLAEVSGLIRGPAATVALEGTPFVIETSVPNARFSIPVQAGHTFTLSFLDPQTGAERGTASGTAPADGQPSLDIGSPLAGATTPLIVDARPGEDSLVDIDAPIELGFSEPVDPRSLNRSAVVVTDPAGRVVSGSFSVAGDGTRAEFLPDQRWRYATSYRYQLTQDVVALSGAHLAQSLVGRFTTFAPRLLGQASLGDVRALAVYGSLALAGTTTGLDVLSLENPSSPERLAQLAFAGGVSALAILPDAALTDRNGDPLAGTLGLATTGGGAAQAQLQIVDLTALRAALDVVSVAASALANAGPGDDRQPLEAALAAARAALEEAEPTSRGTVLLAESSAIPRGLVAGDGGRVFVALRGVGLLAFDLSASVPSTAGNPATTIAARFPSSGSGNAEDVALANGRVVVADGDRLHVLETDALGLVGSTPSGSRLTSVAAASASLSPERGADRPSLIVAGSEGTGALHLFDADAGDTPALRSIVRVCSGVSRVTTSSEWGLGYASCGTQGLAIVDLDASPSLQLADTDLNGQDDRVLARIDTGGFAGVSALHLARSVAYAADQTAGLAVAQVVPPSTKFESIVRDPALAIAGEEESILEKRSAFTTDQAFLVSVGASMAEDAQLFLTLEERPKSGSSQLLRFAGSGGTTGTTTPLRNGSNTLRIDSNPSLTSQGSDVTLIVRDGSGRVADEISFDIAAPDLSGLTLEGLLAGPSELSLDATHLSQAVAVAGFFDDGRFRNLTSPSSGTAYETSDTDVATVSTEGIVLAGAGGKTDITASNAEKAVSVPVSVATPPIVTDIRVVRPYVTLTALGQQEPITVMASLSDGTERDISAESETSYASAAPEVASVGGTGAITAVGEGATQVVVSRRDFSATVVVGVEPRTPPALTGITLEPFEAGLTTDDSDIPVKARVSGSGSLEGLSVTFETTPAALQVVDAVTGYGGEAVGSLAGTLAAGTFQITASIIDPGSGARFQATGELVIAAGTGDHEPNDVDTSPSRLALNRTAAGTVGGIGDAQDGFEVPTTRAGTLQLSLTLTSSTDPSQIRVCVLSQAFEELSCTVPSLGLTASLSIAAPAGAARAVVEGGSEATGYQLSAELEPAVAEITSVSPEAGPPDTLVTIAGSGFDLRPGANTVLFGGIVAVVTSAQPNELRTKVPANAPNGLIQVVAGESIAVGPEFITGRESVPTAELTPGEPESIRLDPVTGTRVLSDRLYVRMLPSAGREVAQALATEANATIVTFLPMFNAYVFDLGNARSIADIYSVAHAIGSDVNVSSIFPVPLFRPLFQIDSRDSKLPNNHSYSSMGLSSALERIRSMAQFRDPISFNPVHIAVVDQSFSLAPAALSEFSISGNSVIRRFMPYGGLPSFHSGFIESIVPSPSSGNFEHGVAVSGHIVALNNNSMLSGVFSSLFRPDERLQATARLSGAVSFYSVGIPGKDDWDFSLIAAALEDIARINQCKNCPDSRIDVVNLSLGTPSVFAGLRGTDLLPDAADLWTRDLENRISVLADTVVVAAAGNRNLDVQHIHPAQLSQTLGNVISVTASTVQGERSIYMDPEEPVSNLIRARYGSCGRNGVNCGSVTISATTGEYDFSPSNLLLPGEGSTSLAAPMVTGAVAVLRAIAPPSVKWSPRYARDLIVRNGQDISAVWNRTTTGKPGKMVRLDLDAAAIEMLGIETDDRVFVIDEVLERALAIEVDSSTGYLRESEPSVATASSISLEVGLQEYGVPSALEVSPTRQEAYAAVASPKVGILLIDTTELKARSFIEVGGDPIGEKSLVVSPDGRLLYFAQNARVGVVNLETERLIRDVDDLPAPYAPGSFQDRVERLKGSFSLVEIEDRSIRIQEELLGLSPSARITGLELAPDGATLYGAVEMGKGAGFQPGALIALDADLARDGSRTQPGLQYDLSTYFRLREAPARMADAGGFTGGDEPSDVGVSPDGKYVYLLNGGINQYAGVSDTVTAAALLQLAETEMLLHLAAVGLSRGLFGNVAALATFSITFPTISESYVGAYREAAASGIVIAAAPGYTGVFKVQGAVDGGYGGLKQVHYFPRSVKYAWNATGRTDQVALKAAYASRPRAIAIRADGKRALIGYFGSGNVGVLDLDRQGNLPNLALNSVPSDLFRAVLAVTPSVPLDNLHKALVPEGDLLFVRDVEYAQSGEFAVVAHAGSPGGEGGGAVSIVRDRGIEDDFGPIGSWINRGAYFGKDPIGGAVKNWRWFDLGDGSGKQRLRRPRTVAVAPVLRLAMPRFGEEVGFQPIAFSWSDRRANGYECRMFDLGLTRDQEVMTRVTGDAISCGDWTFNALEMERRWHIRFDDPRLSGLVEAKHWYRLEITLVTDAGEKLVTSRLVVRGDQAT